MTKLVLRHPFMLLARANGGATSIEYGLIAALIALLLIAAVRTLGVEIAELIPTLAGVLEP